MELLGNVLFGPVLDQEDWVDVDQFWAEKLFVLSLEHRVVHQADDLVDGPEDGDLFGGRFLGLGGGGTSFWRRWKMMSVKGVRRLG